jgi:hypothetical protein
MTMFLMRAGLLVLCVYSTYTTSVRARVWTDELALWQQAVTHSPEKPRAWANLAAQTARAGALPLAEQYYALADVKALAAGRSMAEQTIGHAILQTNLALFQADRGEYPEALARLAALSTKTADTLEVMAWLTARSVTP